MKNNVNRTICCLTVLMHFKCSSNIKLGDQAQPIKLIYREAISKWCVTDGGYLLALWLEGKKNGNSPFVWIPHYAYFFSKTFNNILIIQNFAVKSCCHVEFIMYPDSCSYWTCINNYYTPDQRASMPFMANPNSSHNYMN